VKRAIGAPICWVRRYGVACGLALRLDLPCSISHRFDEPISFVLRACAGKSVRVGAVSDIRRICIPLNCPQLFVCQRTRWEMMRRVLCCETRSSGKLWCVPILRNRFISLRSLSHALGNLQAGYPHIRGSALNGVRCQVGAAFSACRPFFQSRSIVRAWACWRGPSRPCAQTV